MDNSPTGDIRTKLREFSNILLYHKANSKLST
jgi:hypothetical protein